MSKTMDEAFAHVAEIARCHGAWKTKGPRSWFAEGWQQAIKGSGINEDVEDAERAYEKVRTQLQGTDAAYNRVVDELNQLKKDATIMNGVEGAREICRLRHELAETHGKLARFSQAVENCQRVVGFKDRVNGDLREEVAILKDASTSLSRANNNLRRERDEWIAKFRVTYEKIADVCHDAL